MDDDPLESASRRLIEAHLAMVVSIAERHRSTGIPMLDLIEKGNHGLLRALQTFAGRSTESFSAYAAECVEKAISKAE